MCACCGRRVGACTGSTARINGIVQACRADELTRLHALQADGMLDDLHTVAGALKRLLHERPPLLTYAKYEHFLRAVGQSAVHTQVAAHVTPKDSCVCVYVYVCVCMCMCVCVCVCVCRWK